MQKTGESRRGARIRNLTRASGVHDGGMPETTTTAARAIGMASAEGRRDQAAVRDAANDRGR